MPENTVSPSKTASIGNAAAGQYPFSEAGGGRRVQYLAVRWDGDKIRGILWRYADGSQHSVGGFATNASLTDYTFNSEELLSTFKLKDSGYGYRSVRRIEFTTSTGGTFAAGANGFDNEIDLPVGGALLTGFYGSANGDGFLSNLGLWVGPPHYDLPAIGTPVKAGEGGNPNVGGARPFELHSTTSMVRYVGVRWDGDKVRGISWQCFDGTTGKAGDFDATNYTLTSYTFDPRESLVTMVIKQSGYGYGSVRRIEFTTSKGGRFAAGADGFDHQVDLPVNGAYLLGFFGKINADNFLNSLGVWTTAPQYAGLPRISSIIDTGQIGSSAGGSAFGGHSATTPVRYLGVRWDGDKVRGLEWQSFDASSFKAGDADAANYTLTSYTFAPGESLVSMILQDSGYGHGSLRRIAFTTSKGGRFEAGAAGFDHQMDLAVLGSYLMGFKGQINPDNFVSSLGVSITPPSYPGLPQISDAVETEVAGNPAAGKTPFDSHSAHVPIRSLGVRWDGDKIRGIGWQCFDNTPFKCGDFDSVQYTLTTYTFDPTESLTSFVIKDSGYGHGSVRRIEFTTSKGGRFAAGPDGFDHQVNLSVQGAYLLGFHGMVNADNFLSSLGAWTSPPQYSGLPRIQSILQTGTTGNAAAAKTPFDEHSVASPIRYLGVRWDGDKIRGISWQTFDGRSAKFGDYDAVAYALTSYVFQPGESLTSLILRDSGYGSGSLRRIEFTTSKGGSFAAGADGFDHELNGSVLGSFLVGAYGGINADNFISSLGFWISTPDYAGLLPAIDAVVKSDGIGNFAAGAAPFDHHSATRPVRYLGVRWDGDKIRGIQWQTFDGDRSTVGDYDAASYTLSSYTFAPDEALRTFTIKSSPYGHGSVSRIEFTTSNGGSFGAGQASFDHELSLPVQGAVLLGFFGAVNVDHFLNGLGLWVSNPRYVVPLINTPLQTAEAGMPQAGATPFAGHSATSPVRYVGIRSDGDKVRGISWQYFDGTSQTFGDYSGGAYALTSYTFAPGESLVSMSIKDSGYGHGSVRRIEFTTSLGGQLVAGPDGFDHETSFGVFGSYLLGFHGVLNADDFLNSLGLWISTPAFSMPAMGPLMSTGEGGNPKAGAHAFDEHSTSSLVRYLGVRSDGDKVRGIGWQCFDGTEFSFGDYGATSYDLTSFSFAPGESLVTLCVQDSGYGHGSVRRIEFTTSNGGRFAAGAGGFDHETSFSVYGSYLAGFHGMINADNFLSSVGLWISAPTAPVVHPGAARETAAAGNPQAGTTRFDQHSATSPVRYLAMRADGDKVRGIEWQSFDGGKQQFGDCDSVGYALTSYTFAPDEPLSTLTIKDSGYGRGSVRRIEFTTSRGSFAAGPGGFDHETSLSVHGSYLLGFSGLINVDNFVSSLAAWISPPDPPQLVVDATRRSDAIGNAPAGKTPFDETSAASPIRYLGVRWDGDKIRGMAWEHFDGTRHTSADYDATSYTLTSYTFAPDEFLTSLTLKDSGWGHGSVRRIEFRTSNGGVFAAGPDGFDTALSVPAYGSVLLGFYGTINVDNFLSSLGAYVSAPATMNGWDYALGLDQRLLNTLMPLLAQINPPIHTPFGDIQLQRAWIASQPASPPGVLYVGVQVTGSLRIMGAVMPTGGDTIWRIVVGIKLDMVDVRVESIDGRLNIKIEFRDKTAFSDLAVEFAPANAGWSQIVAANLLRALQGVAAQPLHVASLDAPKLPGLFSSVTGWLPTYIELAHVAGSRAGDPGGLAALVSTSGAAPALDTRRSVYASTWRPGPSLVLYCGNDQLIRLLGGAIEGALRQLMGAQDRYDGNHPLEFSYLPTADGARRRAFTDGNYCNFWSLPFTPSIDWCWIEAADDRINVELRVRAVPLLDAVYYVTLDATITLEVEPGGTILRPHLNVDVHTESHVGPEAGVTIAAVAIAGSVILQPLLGLAATVMAAVPAIIKDLASKAINDQVASADVSNRGAIDLAAMPLFDMTFGSVNVSGSGDLVIGVNIRPWPGAPAAV